MTAGSPDFTIESLGAGRFASPMRGVRCVGDDERVLYVSDAAEAARLVAAGAPLPSFERAGPRARVFFDPGATTCGIVTCGGLCPGINDVIRAVTLSLHHHYGVRRILGFRFGYAGLVKRLGHEPLELTPAAVDSIAEAGGTVLGSSRGPQDPAEMVDYLDELGVGILFTVGGDGTLKGAGAIAAEAARRGRPLAVVGIPKTIDNDIAYMQKTFGFETAVEEAHRAVYAAHAEAVGARDGVGLVKLMGRDSGFIAAYTALVDSQVNFCLVPELPFTLDGFLDALERRLDLRGHAVVVAAEGAGQHLLAAPAERDASGNLKHGNIGIFLRDAIGDHFARQGRKVPLKYIDPSYIIRSQPANTHDSALCLLLGQSAVHAGMAGRTNVVVGVWNHEFVHVPFDLATSARRRIDPDGWLWSSVMASTGQPRRM
ncbi:MAG: ATP-dependent 6-phosphofructokinase [Krumholzibacteria bacterium]|nr:ATP-dependent 6-phosphofructokinase [Candidatus Krumholzibacteria bacterium]